MKKVIGILISLILSLAIVFILPNYLLSDEKSIDISHLNEVSAVKQNVLGYSEDKITYHKLYYQNRLIGVISNLDYFNKKLNEDYDQYAEEFKDSSLGLIEDCYIVNETSNVLFENIDDEIVEYCKDGDEINGSYIGIKTTAVEFSNENGIYDIIYVPSKEMFDDALNRFLVNFISEDSLEKIRNNDTIDSPNDFTSVDTGLRIAQTISYSESTVPVSAIYDNETKIYDYLCYGRDTERQYYETKIGDTVQAVGYYFGDMSAKQVMMLNPDIIMNEDQILAPGTVLNVTYYNSPIEVYVTKQRLTQETVLPDSPLYKEDDTLKQGSRRIDVEEENGVRNVLFEEIWINGVVQGGKELSSNMIKEPIQGVIALGTMALPDVGTGNWRWPVNNPIITCNYVCYSNHGGVDFQNRYNHYDVIYAADSGVVSAVGYTDVGGYYAKINHNNGYVTYYGHMRSYPYVEVGQVVERGDVLGPIGMTGVATGPHVHFAMYYRDTLIDPCSVLACNLVARG